MQDALRYWYDSSSPTVHCCNLCLPLSISVFVGRSRWSYTDCYKTAKPSGHTTINVPKDVRCCLKIGGWKDRQDNNCVRQPRPNGEKQHCLHLFLGFCLRARSATSTRMRTLLTEITPNILTLSTNVERNAKYWNFLGQYSW